MHLAIFIFNLKNHKILTTDLYVIMYIYIYSNKVRNESTFAK